MGEGIWYRHGNQPEIINNIIAGNHTNGQGGGMALSASASMVIAGKMGYPHHDEYRDRETIDISTLPKGTYFLNLIFDDQVSGKCVIVL